MPYFDFVVNRLLLQKKGMFRTLDNLIESGDFRKLRKALKKRRNYFMRYIRDHSASLRSTDVC